MRIKLDAKSVARLKLPDGKKEEIFWDEELPGFGLRHRLIGDRVVRTWLVQYRAYGRTRRMKVGTFDKVSFTDARKAAREVLAKVELGSDPQREKTAGRLQAARTLGAVIKNYLEAKQLEVRPSTYRGIRLYLTGHYFKPLHSTTLSEITLADVAARLNVIKRISGHTALQARTTLSGLYVWAMGEGLVVGQSGTCDTQASGSSIARSGAIPRRAWRRLASLQRWQRLQSHRSTSDSARL